VPENGSSEVELNKLMLRSHGIKSKSKSVANPNNEDELQQLELSDEEELEIYPWDEEGFDLG
jgi:hypothetical protein